MSDRIPPCSMGDTVYLRDPEYSQFADTTFDTKHTVNWCRWSDTQNRWVVNATPDFMTTDWSTAHIWSCWSTTPVQPDPVFDILTTMNQRLEIIEKKLTNVGYLK